MRRILVIVAVVVVGGVVAAVLSRGTEAWLTVDQQADRLLQRGDAAGAAELYRDPLRAGVAWYRAGEFDAAAQVWRGSSRPASQFNLGNALVLQGKYDDAIEAYDRALAERPDWPEAEANRELARLRAERLELEGGESTGGMLGADEISFDATRSEGQPAETTAGEEPLTDAALQQLWLQRIQTRPAEFLRSKFAYQVQQGGSE